MKHADISYYENWISKDEHNRSQKIAPELRFVCRFRWLGLVCAPQQGCRQNGNNVRGKFLPERVLGSYF